MSRPGTFRSLTETSPGAPNVSPLVGTQTQAPNLGSSPNVNTGKALQFGTALIAQDSFSMLIAVPTLAAGGQNTITKPFTFANIPTATSIGGPPSSSPLQFVAPVGSIPQLLVWTQIMSGIPAGGVVNTMVQPYAVDVNNTKYSAGPTALSGGVTYKSFGGSLQVVISALTAVASGPTISLTVFGILSLTFPPKQSV